MLIKWILNEQSLMFIPNLCWNIFNYTNSDKTPFTWCGIPKAVYSALLFFIGWYTLWCLNFLHFLSIRMLDLKSTVEIYVDVSTVENWLFCRLSCMLNKYSGNYWKNFKYKVTSIASKSQVTPSSSNGNYRRDVGCNLFDLRSEYA